nr:hypothetical protein [Tanacetum cinerariifolium]
MYHPLATKLRFLRLTRRLERGYCLLLPDLGVRLGESSVAAAARQPGPTMARSKDRATVRAEIEVLRRERLAYEQESIQTREALARSKAYSRALEKMAPKRTTRSTQVPPVTPALTTTTTTVTEAQLQALIDRGVATAMAEAEASRVRNYYDNNGVALTWWNSHVKTITLEVAQALPWKTLKKIMTDKYCLRGKIKKLETEMWELKTKGTYVIGYSHHFQELALMCNRMFLEEFDRVEKYIGGLPDMIHDSVKAARPKTMQEAIEFATELMDKRIRDVVENKQMFEGTSRNNQNQPQQNKRQNTSRAYAVGNSDRNIYTGSKPLCSKCDYHHEGPCPPRCHNYKRVGHLTKGCRCRPANANNNTNNNNNQKGNGFYECGAQGHFKRNCPKLKNNNRDNQGGNDNAQARVYVVGNVRENPNNVIAGTFLLFNRYAYILFDTGTDRSFVSTTFSSQIDIAPIALDHHYNVEIVDGRIIGLKTIMRDCTLNFLNQPFNIDLLPVELGSFDVIIDMDWLSLYNAIIACAEKLVRIPFGNGILTIHEEGSNERNESRLNIISCFKAQEYMSKGCHVFLANITSTKDEDKSKGKVYKTKFLTLRSSSPIIQEERWIVLDVHRLPGIKQTNGKEPLPTAKD